MPTPPLIAAERKARGGVGGGVWTVRAEQCDTVRACERSDGPPTGAVLICTNCTCLFAVADSAAEVADPSEACRKPAEVCRKQWKVQFRQQWVNDSAFVLRIYDSQLTNHTSMHSLYDSQLNRITSQCFIPTLPYSLPEKSDILQMEFASNFAMQQTVPAFFLVFVRMYWYSRM